jgi:hypothetical protein
MLIAVFIVGACAGGVFVAVMQCSAVRAERIYQARHRDHSKVPPINA